MLLQQTDKSFFLLTGTGQGLLSCEEDVGQCKGQEMTHK